MTTRITGINSGLDVDALVKASMTTYQNKIDKETQNKKVLEYQQEQYKKIISDASDFYDKYFDILKTGNLMSSSTYQSVSFKSSDSDSAKVTAKGFAGADVSDYKVTTTQLASKATNSFDESKLTGEDNAYISVKVGTKTASVAIVKADGEIDMATTVKNLNTALNTAGINVSSKYSEFTNSIVLESGTLGESVSFQSGVGAKDVVTDTSTGTNAKGVITKGTETYSFDKASNTVSIDNVQFTLKGVSESTTGVATVSALADVTDADGAITTKTTKTTETLTKTEDGITTKTTKITSPDGITSTTTDGTTTTKTNKTVGGVTTKTITTKTVDGVTTTTTIENGVTTTKKTDGTTTTTTTINADATTTTIITKDGKTTTGTADDAIEALTPLDDLVDGAGVTLTTTTNETKTITNGTTTTKILTTSVDGTTTDKTTTTTDGTTTTITAFDGTITSTDSTTGAVSVTKGSTITNYTSASLSGSTDVTALKDKIVSFVNEYNTLLTSINTKIYEERDTDYLPLTDAQKEEMTDDQIEKWETKAKTGLIRKDSDLERITNAMKRAMSSVMSGSGLCLEKIGIKPVENYAEKNGTYTINEDTLTQALEENSGNVKDLFTRSASTTNTNDKGGIFTQLASTLKSEFKTSTSSLSKKVGLDGTSTQYSNTLTKSIYAKKLLIADLNDLFTDKETALYNKYSALETALQTLNSQQASLSSMLGTS
ncbi:hypothetical protein EHW71_03595 [Clostridium butyricum]|uniref:flagellar filament capping protein FliD n=1 Tax=Clostridium butyricum TaxID=1492 RepID=UPI000F52CAF8|nr:flagellar filament capping protein FliD [Clostridium butyricum]RQN12314.1 hypothetical protein EHW71_03595 [Clostridium butyricum]